MQNLKGALQAFSCISRIHALYALKCFMCFSQTFPVMTADQNDIRGQ